MPDPHFILTTCQVGAERALKAEFARRYPRFRPAFARPGFVTFKSPEEFAPQGELPEAVFARAVAHALGQVRCDEAQLPDEAWKLAGEREYAGLHVWHRDAAPPGERGYEPGLKPEDAALAQRLRAARPDAQLNTWVSPGTTVLDCVAVDPGLWFVGWHCATHNPATTWPGGMTQIPLPEDAVSRAYLKMEEALRWAQFRMEAGQLWAELGSAPGGAAQALLARGMRVLAVDPAEIHPAVAAAEGFTHLRKRSAEVRRREFRKVRWLAADMNVAPRYTLDAVEDVVTHREAHVRGLLLTLKLLDWKFADEIPEYLFRVRSWGFKDVRARQLQHNRREFCVAALRLPGD